MTSTPAEASTPDAPAEAEPARAGLRTNRNYQRVWFAGAISGLGDIVFTTAVVLWVGAIIAKGQTWAPLAVTGVLFSAMGPAVLLGPIGGVFADRWNRRRTMLVTDLLRAAIIGSLILLPTAGKHLSIGVTLTLIYVGVALESAVAQFFNPSRFGLMGTVVADADRERAGSIAQGTDAVTSIIGPPMAAPLLVSAANGPQWALAVNAVSFLVSFAATSLVRVPDAAAGAGERAKGSAIQEFRAGIRFVFGNRTLRLIIVAIIVVTVGASAVNVLDLFFVTVNLHLRASLYGLMDAAFGFGSVVGAVIFAVAGKRLKAHNVFSYGLLLGGLGIAAYSRSTVLWVALLVLFLLALPVAGVNSMVGPLIFRQTPREMLGRVAGVVNPLQRMATFGGMAVSTWLASTALRNLDAHVAGIHFGPIDTIFFAGGLLVALTGAWSLVVMRGVMAPVAAPTPAEAVASSLPAPAVAPTMEHDLVDAGSAPDDRLPD